MALREKLTEDLKERMRSRSQFEVGVLRMLLSSIHNREIEKQGKTGSPDLSEDEVIDVLRREAKKRKEAMDIYMKANRRDLGEKEGRELEIIKRYLPKEMADAEIEAIVKEVIASGAKDFGGVMKAAMAKIGGEAEASRVAEVVKQLLG